MFSIMKNSLSQDTLFVLVERWKPALEYYGLKNLIKDENENCVAISWYIISFCMISRLKTESIIITIVVESVLNLEIQKKPNE